MKSRQISWQKLPQYKIARVNAEINDLKIDRIEYFKDAANHHMILLMESNPGFPEEVTASIGNNNLIIEAAPTGGYSRPFRTHLLNHRILAEYQYEEELLSKSIVQLDSRYNYEILSYQISNPYLLKVVLHFERHFLNNSHSIN